MGQTKIESLFCKIGTIKFVCPIPGWLLKESHRVTPSMFAASKFFESDLKNCLGRFGCSGLKHLKTLSKLPKGMTCLHILNFVFAVYVDASQACNLLSFQLGTTGIGTVIPTRSWSLKVIFYRYYV